MVKHSGPGNKVLELALHPWQPANFTEIGFKPREGRLSLENAVLTKPKRRVKSPPTSLRDRLVATRHLSTELARPLSDEDQVVQANDDASPTKWHLAHTTWFFEAFLLKRFLPGYRVFDENFEYCFNSYYESVGPQASARRSAGC